MLFESLKSKINKIKRDLHDKKMRRINGEIKYIASIIEPDIRSEIISYINLLNFVNKSKSSLSVEFSTRVINGSFILHVYIFENSNINCISSNQCNHFMMVEKMIKLLKDNTVYKKFEREYHIKIDITPDKISPCGSDLCVVISFN